MDQKETIEKKKEMSKLNIIVVITSIVLAFTFILFICRVVPICENLTYITEAYEEVDHYYTWADFCSEYAFVNGRADLSLAAVSAVFMKHIVNMVIAAFIAGIFGAKRAAIVKELDREEKIVLVANTIPCPKCKTGIEKTSSEKLLKCPGCGTEYKNPFYKE